MKYYIVAGERSGDLHGGNLATALKHLDADATMCGFGGEKMKDAGVSVSVHYSQLAFMGWVEVIANLSTIARFMRQCKNEIIEFQPDVVILIDYGGFNTKIAAFAHAHNIKVFYYITPKVCAWNQKRAWKLKATVDRMFVILPFEKDFYKKFDWEVDYVGNPVCDAVNRHQQDDTFHFKHSLQKDKPLVALLPGSRKQELQRIIPLMAEVVRKNADYQFAVAVVNSLDAVLYQPLHDLPNVTFISEDTYNLLGCADAAIVTSGTASLETALFKVPQVVVYKTSTISYSLARWFIKVPFISLVNLIADKEVVKELIQTEAKEPTVTQELRNLLEDQSRRRFVLAEYERLDHLLNIGEASSNAARLMVGYLKN